MNHSGSQHIYAPLRCSSCRHNRVRWVYCSHPILYPPPLCIMLPKITAPLQCTDALAYHILTSHLLPQTHVMSQEYQGRNYSKSRAEPRFETDSH
ncbi:unnamed protein product, partial [Ectocarpus fasciculatus]